MNLSLDGSNALLGLREVDIEPVTLILFLVSVLALVPPVAG
jgi:hypothetical protein